MIKVIYRIWDKLCNASDWLKQSSGWDLLNRTFLETLCRPVDCCAELGSCGETLSGLRTFTFTDILIFIVKWDVLCIWLLHTRPIIFLKILFVYKYFTIFVEVWISKFGFLCITVNHPIFSQYNTYAKYFNWVMNLYPHVVVADVYQLSIYTVKLGK